MILPKDVVVLPEMEDHWVVMNVFTRTCLGVESKALSLLKVADSDNKDLLKPFEDYDFQVWEIEWFSNYDGLMADPTRYVRQVSAWEIPEILKADALINRFKKHHLLIENEEQYLNAFRHKTSVLDQEHFGNFHQQLGQHLILNRRESPEKWWIHQKFTDGMLNVKDNLYQAIQSSYLQNYFTSKFKPGDYIVDIGCGPGFYSNMISETGATVLGIDTNETYIEIAQKYANRNTSFETSSIGVKGALDHIPSDSADYVFMSDALLFYFVPIDPNIEIDINVLFADVSRILKPNGRFINVEPHYIFWLLPWLGEVDRPFTILTEYFHKNFGVTVTINELIQTFAKSGFSITWMEELKPVPEFEQINPRAYQFARQFPLWQLFELKSL